MNFRQFPKIELHLHLDCSLSFDFVSRVIPDISPSNYLRDYVAPPKCSDLVDYLTRAPKGIALMQTEEELTWSVEDLFLQLEKDNIIYAELRFAPLEHGQKGLDPAEVVEIVEESISKCMKTSGIECRLILCTLRHYNEKQSLEVAGLVGQFKGSKVVALDIAGDEAGFPIEAHLPAFQWARKHGLYCTAHAGEAKGPESIWEALNFLKPDRIGHGVNAAKDINLIRHLVQHQIHLEICPTSNVQTNVCETYSDHPVDFLWQQGVSLNINTDGRALSNIDLSSEYRLLFQHFGWTDAHFHQTNLMAIDAAFIDAKKRAELKQRLLSHSSL